MVLGFVLMMSSMATAAPPPYGLGEWPEAGFGNHRAVVSVAEPAGAVWAHIEWRRRDRDPEAKDIRVYGPDGERVLNVARLDINRIFGDIAFEAKTAGDHLVYTMPYNPAGTGPFGSGFAEPGTYFPPEDTADAAWLERVADGEWRALPEAQVREIQARGEFHRMDPMEVVATEEEEAALLGRHPDASYLLFPEDREHTIRMFEELPYRWIQRGPGDELRGEARPGEYYVWQVGVYAARDDIEALEVECGDLAGSAVTCVNVEGTDWLGRPMKPEFNVARGRVRPLWFGAQVPRDAEGTYTGTVTIEPDGADATDVRVTLEVGGDVLEDAGDGELWRLSRLRWLNSTLGIDDEVIPPFEPLKVKGRKVTMLGREVSFGSAGLPERVVSNGRDVLSAPMKLVVESGGIGVTWKPGKTRVTRRTDAVVERVGAAAADGLTMQVTSKTEFDGCIKFDCTLTARENLTVDDIRLEVPVARDVAKYMMGMGKRGGYRPPEWEWEWNVERANQMVWLGDWNAGVQLKLSGAEDAWQMNHLRDTGIPDSWGNEGRGGCTIGEEGDAVVLRAYSGERRLKKGEELTFRFRLLVTPFKPIDPRHWSWRYGNTRTDGTVAHVHHGHPANPYINYPFITVDEFRALVDDVKSVRTTQTDFGELTYPAQGNIRTDQGALHAWVRLNFDPHAGGPKQAQYNQALFGLDLPNQDQLGFYWNIDDRGMRAYVRTGPPEQNKYPVLFGTHSPDWEKGQRHRLTVSWGERLAIFVDGKLMGQGAHRGILPHSLERATLNFTGDGFALDAVKITDQPYEAGEAIEPLLDEGTLLLETFTAVVGGEARPAKSAGGSVGALTGTFEMKDGEHGPELLLTSKEVPVPEKGVNVYYTVRELSNHVAELWALRSLGDEVYETGGQSIYADDEVVPQGGYAWLREHLLTGYVPAWRTALGEDVDSAIAQQPLSRWHNYYVEGMNWLMRDTGLDGLYLDGIGYDREIMKRIAKVMHRADSDYRVNFHSGDGWSPPWDPGRLVSPANLYMEHFPYISNLWFGELYDYNMPPDYWLVEVSGIPFGLTGEMLNYQTGGNAYRGMVYGMTSRQHPSHSGMWRLWDEFGIQDAEWLGYWHADCPVKTGRSDVLASAYRKPGKTLIALASWPEQAGPPSANVRAAPQAPTVDGTIAPGEWDGAAKLTNFTLFGDDAAAGDQTEVYITRDGERLYVGFRCRQSAGRPKADATARDSEVWLDDAFEVFVQPDREDSRYVQLVGNSAGVFSDSEGTDLTWNGAWEYRANVGEGHWDGELSIAFVELGMEAPREGDAIGLNFCRDRVVPRPEQSCWAPATVTFHDPSIFGKLTFSEGRPVTRQELPTGDGAAPGTVNVRLAIDWGALGIDAETAVLRAPKVEHFQSAAEFAPGDTIPVEPGKGWLLVVEARP